MNGEEADEVVSPARAANGRLMVISPRLGTGWETVVDDLSREVRLRFKLLGLALPVKRRIPFSQVTHVAVVCRESWWSVPTERWESWMESPKRTVTEMSTKGWRYDLLMTQKGGRNTRLEALKSSQRAEELARQLRQRLGLRAPEGSTKR